MGGGREGTWGGWACAYVQQCNVAGRGRGEFVVWFLFGEEQDKLWV